MGQSTNHRRRKFYGNVDDSVKTKARKKAEAIRRHREAKIIRKMAMHAATLRDTA